MGKQAEQFEFSNDFKRNSTSRAKSEPQKVASDKSKLIYRRQYLSESTYLPKGDCPSAITEIYPRYATMEEAMAFCKSECDRVP